jgi:hypothetical protein
LRIWTKILRRSRLSHRSCSPRKSSSRMRLRTRRNPLSTVSRRVRSDLVRVHARFNPANSASATLRRRRKRRRRRLPPSLPPSLQTRNLSLPRRRRSQQSLARTTRLRCSTPSLPAGRRLHCPLLARSRRRHRLPCSTLRRHPRRLLSLQRHLLLSSRLRRRC